MALTGISKNTDYTAHVLEILRSLPLDKQARLSGYADALAEEPAVDQSSPDDAKWMTSTQKNAAILGQWRKDAEKNLRKGKTVPLGDVLDAAVEE